MRVRKLQLSNSNQQGFTLVELVIVIGILAVLSSMALGEFYHRRTMAFDRQAIAVSKNLLSLAVTAFANDENPGIENTTVGTYPPGYPELDVTSGIHTKIDMISGANGDVWHFYVAAEGGSTAYFFWLPGDNCTETAVNGYPSDTLVDNNDLTAPIPDWRNIHFGI